MRLSKTWLLLLFFGLIADKANAQGECQFNQECEAISNLKALFIAESSYYVEQGHYTDRILADAGFLPDACPDGSRASVPDDRWVGGCHFIYRVQLEGSQQYTGFAQGTVDPLTGVNFYVTSQHVLTREVSWDVCQ